MSLSLSRLISMGNERNPSRSGRATLTDSDALALVLKAARQQEPLTPQEILLLPKACDQVADFAADYVGY